MLKHDFFPRELMLAIFIFNREWKIYSSIDANLTLSSLIIKQNSYKKWEVIGDNVKIFLSRGCIAFCHH